MAFTEIEKGMAKRNIKQFCKKWEELTYDEIHNKPYFIGKRTKKSSTEILFPIDCYKTMTFDELKTSIIDSGSTAVNLAVCNSDSTVVMYKAELGLKPPKDLGEREVPDIPSSELTLKRKSTAITNNQLTTSVDIEQAETNSTNDCLQIDLQPDDASAMSESEATTEDSDNSDSVIYQLN